MLGQLCESQRTFYWEHTAQKSGLTLLIFLTTQSFTQHMKNNWINQKGKENIIFDPSVQMTSVYRLRQQTRQSHSARLGDLFGIWSSLACLLAMLFGIHFWIILTPEWGRSSRLLSVAPANTACHLVAVTWALGRLNCTTVVMLYYISNACLQHTWHTLGTQHSSSCQRKYQQLRLGSADYSTDTPPRPPRTPGPQLTQLPSGSRASARGGPPAPISWDA